MLKSLSRPACKQRGFSLVEIMVGMIIGMLGIIIIMQVTSVFEARKRTTSSGDDAQNGGAISLSSLQRDLAQAGYALSKPQLINSSLVIPASGVRPAITLNPLLPVTINPANPVALAAIGDAGTSKIMLIYGNSSNVEGSTVFNSALPFPNPAGANSPQNQGGFLLSNSPGNYANGDGGKGFNVGEFIIPSQSGVSYPLPLSHNLYQIIAPPATPKPGLAYATGGVPLAQLGWSLSDQSPILFNLGTLPTLRIYAVINHTLSVCDYFNVDCTSLNNWSALTGDVYAFRAICESPTSVRIALVSRNAQPDPSDVTTTPPTWRPSGVVSDVVSAAVLTAAAPTGKRWQQFRYKTFETVVPIRNAVWSGVQGCV